MRQFKGFKFEPPSRHDGVERFHEEHVATSDELQHTTFDLRAPRPESHEHRDISAPRV